jgi:hypothetical protein
MDIGLTTGKCWGKQSLVVSRWLLANSHLAFLGSDPLLTTAD